MSGLVRVVLVVLAIVLLALPALAALPPHYQRARELAAVIDAAAAILEFKPIESVTRVGDDLYRVQTEDCTLDVRIEGLTTSAGIVGPRQFKVVPGEPSCR